MSRFAALHDWPALSIRASTAAWTVSSRLSVPRTMNGSEPPISSTTFFRFRPAISATAAPARPEPGAGDGAPARARIGDHPLDLLVRGVDVHIGAVREARVGEELRHRLGRLRA